LSIESRYFEIATIFRKEVLAMSAYKVADAHGLIKLDAMENPYNWPEDLKLAWLDTLKDCPLNRYPDPTAQELSQTIRRIYQIDDQFDLWHYLTQLALWRQLLALLCTNNLATALA
jgi:histidinol-phosphate/aromatic aminotransferase/cobyric acid decarboxylase-like protein